MLFIRRNFVAKNNMSLATLIKNDPALSERIQRIAEDVREDNQKIKSFSQTYNQKYKKELLKEQQRNICC